MDANVVQLYTRAYVTALDWMSELKIGQETNAYFTQILFLKRSHGCQLFSHKRKVFSLCRGWRLLMGFVPYPGPRPSLHL